MNHYTMKSQLVIEKEGEHFSVICSSHLPPLDLLLSRPPIVHRANAGVLHIKGLHALTEGVRLKRERACIKTNTALCSAGLGPFHP